jgi:tetratricopeptide (TPR) repeat protein
MENRYVVYQTIRHNRVFKTIGKMSWWRIVLGISLLVVAVLISGVVSQSLASRNHFALAQKLMISPSWMEKYKPETKAFIDGGVLYEMGDYETAISCFAKAEEIEAAANMQSSCHLMLAEKNLNDGAYDTACAELEKTDVSLLSESQQELYLQLCESLRLDYAAITQAG